MPRDVPVGNGSMLITFDSIYQLTDIYFPFVGSENHSPGDINRTGIWIDGQFAWLSDDAWRRSIAYESDSIVTRINLEHDGLQVRLVCNDAVDFDRTISSGASK